MKTIPSEKAGQLKYILEGKMRKFYEDNVFYEMDYVLNSNEDETLTIGQYIRRLEKDTESRPESLKIGRVLTLALK